MKEIRDPEGKTIKSFSSPAPTQVLSEDVAKELQQMMVLTMVQGTGKKAQVPGLESAGKTGSVETGQKNAQGNPVSHAWFVGYTPRELPQVAIAVFVEAGGVGGATAAEVFREVVEGLQQVNFPWT